MQAHALQAHSLANLTAIAQINLDQVDSTQLEAKRQLGNTTAPFVVRANTQTQGRGRSGRPWISQCGNYFATFVLPWNDVARAPLLSYVTAYALKLVLEARGAKDIAIKWPNDVLMGTQKLAGILLEYVDGHLFIGVGVNVTLAPDTTNIDARGFAPISLNELQIELEDFHEIFEESLFKEIEKFTTYGFEPLRQALQECLWVRSELVYENGNSKELVRVIGIDPDGALEVEGKTGRRKVVAGDLFPN